MCDRTTAGSLLSRVVFAGSLVWLTGVCAQETVDAVFRWDFDEFDAGSGRVQCLTATHPMVLGEWSPDGGVGGSGAVVCGEGKRTIRAYFHELTDATVTVELCFKPTAPVTRESVLLSYAEHSYGRGVFDVFLDGKGHVGARFVLRSPDAKRVLREAVVLSREHPFPVGQWATLRVESAPGEAGRGGTLRLYVNGRPDRVAVGTIGFADLDSPIAKEYPLLKLGSQVWSNKPTDRPFTGLIDNVTITQGAMPAPAVRKVASVEARRSGPASVPVQIGTAAIVSRLVSAAPAVDGTFDDPCWVQAECTGPFMVLGKLSATVTGLWEAGDPKFAATAATVQVCHDAQNLYVAYRVPAPADVPATAKVTEHDGGVWNDDCIELFLDPMRRLGFRQILVNAIGTVADGRSEPGSGGFDMSWESRARVETARDGAGYRVEMAVPFTSLGDPPRTAGTVWGANFTREGASCGGLSTWAPVGKSFSTPERFGLLIFESRKAYHTKALDRLARQLESLPLDRTPALARQARTQLAALRTRIDADGEEPAAWETLVIALDELEGSLRQIAMDGRSSIVWRKDVWGSIRPDEPVMLDVEPLRRISVRAGRNTRVATGFLVTNLSTRLFLGRLAVAQSPPKPGDGAAHAVPFLAPAHLSFRRGLYIEADNGVLAPDALASLPEYGLIEVPSRSTVLVWTEIDTFDLAPGSYGTRVELIPSYPRYETAEIEIVAKVVPLDFSVPHVPLFTYLSSPNSQRFPYVARDHVRHGITTAYFLPGLNRGYPKLDKEGAIVAMDHGTLDAIVGNLNRAGLPAERITFLVLLAFDYSWYRNLMYEGKSQLTFGTAAWEQGFANALRTIRDRLFEHGLTYEQILFYTEDEPHGDPGEEGTSAHYAFAGARYVKGVDPRFRVMCNPSLKGEDARFLPQYLDRFDVLEPYRPHIETNRGIIARLQASGREIWTYHILGKSTPPAVYRGGFWQNARDGFSGCSAFWAWESHSGDPFYSYDAQKPGSNRTADYGVVYWDRAGERILPSRRYEAWYQGNQDFRVITICRGLLAKLKAKGADVQAYEANLTRVVEGAVGKSCPELDTARDQLLTLAVELQGLLDR